MVVQDVHCSCSLVLLFLTILRASRCNCYMNPLFLIIPQQFLSYRTMQNPKQLITAEVTDAHHFVKVAFSMEATDEFERYIYYCVIAGEMSLSIPK
jgi:hypothetical protein